ncbi:MAG: aldo/keto reductase [Planctomycetota bacterium]
MNYRPLGRTGLSVSAVSYGTNMLGRRPDPERPGDAECTTEDYFVRMAHVALEEGVNLFDTANCYQDGRSEELLGKALKEHGADAFIATKVGAISRDFSAEGIRRETEDCLRRLQSGCIDLLQLHNPSADDLKTAGWREGLDSLREAGKARCCGVSVSTVGDGLYLMERGLVDALQVNFNIFRSAPREEMLPMAAERGVGVLTKIPLARGLLSGKYGSASRFAEGDWHRQGFVGKPEAMLAAIDRLKELAEAEGISLAQLALRWVLSHEGVSAAIPGAKRIEHLRDNARAGRAGPLPPPLYEAVEEVAAGARAEG